ncbi:hypothetical protein [Arthrobacter sp. B2a2-09]|uniref:hypothetical protein n=1 Tax=Arthrobacter sp. B2a2-09 TaxID=2952822 RepID=UPI0022CD5F3B|nr:hypothetical protein [Arthrobacter sp. B2a2-09]MCZ9884122.1 hypothetical protein [Arthrobacter sp. B2a2-09]
MKPLTVSNDYHPEALRRFNGDTAEHEMEILLDQGLYRHIRFKKPGTGMYYFDLITWPGNLTIKADMGCYTFARTEDMFSFFADGTAGRNGYINAQYWAEKIQSVDRQSSVKEFDEALFRQYVIQDFWEHRENWEASEARQIWAAIREQILDPYYDRHDARACHDLLQDFASPISGFDYADSYDWGGFDDYSFHYLWCCHAILSGIKHYYAAKAGADV